MTDLTSLGYPEGYHMGLSAIFWWIFIAVTAILGVKLYLNARKSDLINVKEMFRAKAILYICECINFSLIQVVMFYPNNFIIIFFIGLSLFTFSGAIYFYYWEKNLTSMKRIPTITSGAACIITIGVLIVSFFTLDFVLFLMDILFALILGLVTIAFLFYIYLIYVFSKYVRGVSTTVSRLWMVGMIIVLIGLAFEYPPGAKIFSSFLVFYIPPISIMICNIIAYYGVITLFPHISSYYAQTQKCAVHRGTFEKGNIIYYCPSCGITYCESCFNQVIKKDGCWNCRQGAEPEIEKEWKIEQVIELKKIDNPKNNNIEKGK